MKKYFYFASVALMSVALASCEKKPETHNPKPETRNLKLETQNSKTETRIPKPETRNM